jgi:hypothetical protein
VYFSTTSVGRTFAQKEGAGLQRYGARSAIAGCSKMKIEYGATIRRFHMKTYTEQSFSDTSITEGRTVNL